MKLGDFGDCTETGGPQYALNLYTLAESIKAEMVLEVGAGWGWSARAFALSLASRNGLLVSIDPHPERIKPENKGRIAALGMRWDVLPERSENAPFSGSVDLLYIDGDPRNVGADFNRYYENVRAGGLVIIDGYGGQPGPTEFVESVTETPFLTLPYNNVYSHAVHRKPAPPLREGKYEAICAECPRTFEAPTWSGLDELIDAHVTAAFHAVKASAGPRNIRYIKEPR